MARDAVSITGIVLNDGVARPAGTAITPANGAEIDAGYTDNLLIEVRNTAAAEYDVTIRTGVGPLAALGDLVVPVPATSGVKLIAVDSARFVQADGKIHLDFEALMAGTVAAYRLPKGL